ncbi:type II toxin-antitoxin system HicB family antitoxin [Salinicoccus halitifaciens]|uniref:RNase H-like HicB family nuclease n=1 Tax=Salinicoccus halitifaciens TaxID=1073415 RepID=A0ABV2ECC1_9STAP|nr:type II toxin-antitoxin system HicB family antitoxin [Salinicoccus halitifaciens]MCD2138757.1 type II toxin-antitoxin system HicB family antitoxin [Salinicoccus halitifaciens]
MMKTVDDYMNLNYKLSVSPRIDFDGTKYYVAMYEELKGLEGVGGDKIEAVEDLEIGKEIWLQTMLENGEEIPLPKNH